MKERYIVGLDPNTEEIIVGDVLNLCFFLRGSVIGRKEIKELVRLANKAYVNGQELEDETTL